MIRDEPCVREVGSEMEVLYKLLLTLNSTSFILVVYLIQKEHYLIFLERQPLWMSHLFFALAPVLLTWFSLLMKRLLSADSIECEITDAELANHSFLPSYLGYFFVALSVNRLETMVFVYVILFLFTYLSQTIYFNPLFLCFGYHFYYITTGENVRHFIISRKVIRTTKGLSFPRLRRINSFTYIDTEDTEEENRNEPCDCKGTAEGEGSRKVQKGDF